MFFALHAKRATMPNIARLPMPSTYLKLMARTTVDVKRLLAGTGLSPDMLTTERPITVAQQLTSIRNSIGMMRRPDWHLAWTRRVAERFHGPISAAWLSAPTLGAGVDAFARYMPARVPYMRWCTRTDDGSCVLTIAPRMPLGELAPILVEIPLLSLVSYVRAMRTGSIGDLVVELTHQPVVRPQIYRRWYDCTFRFGARRNAVVIPRPWYALSNVDYDPALWAAAIGRCRASESTGASDFEAAPAGTVATVTARLHEDLHRPARERPVPTLEEMALRLHLSTRTLSRRLAAEGTSYQALLDQVRMTRARELLGRGERVGQVADALGYAGTSSFDRAFTRWFGRPPRHMRHAGT